MIDQDGDVVITSEDGSYEHMLTADATSDGVLLMVSMSHQNYGTAQAVSIVLDREALIQTVHRLMHAAGHMDWEPPTKEEAAYMGGTSLDEVVNDGDDS